jgi:hypothetical protein
VNTPPTARVLQLHRTLYKAEGSILVQLRTGCIGLRKFLYRCKVPEISTLLCECGAGEETAAHIAMLCALETARRPLLFDECGRQQPWRALTGTPLQARKLTKWLIQSKRIGQFSLARKLLYHSEPGSENRGLQWQKMRRTLYNSV